MLSIPMIRIIQEHIAFGKPRPIRVDGLELLIAAIGPEVVKKPDLT
jgi:hypothetical protein